jgi:hypothetical protein
MNCKEGRRVLVSAGRMHCSRGRLAAPGSLRSRAWLCHDVGIDGIFSRGSASMFLLVLRVSID